MPPVFGPASPSKIRLKSCAGCRGRRCAVGDREQRHLGAVEELLDHDPLALAQRAPGPASRSSVTTTPLPAASPSSFTTYGAPNSSSAAADLVGSQHRSAPPRSARRRRPSRPWRRPWSPRAGRPRRTVRRQAIPRRAHRVGHPGDQAAPRARRRPGRRPAGRPERPRRPVIGSTSCRVATVGRCPGLPGATCTSLTPGSRASARARACSRPPVPMTKSLHGLRSGSCGQRSTIVCSRPGPTPTPQNCAPLISSSAST